MSSPGPLASLDDWLQWLPEISSKEIDLGLERVAEVYDRLNLSRPRKVFTVAGTNGKGSTVQMLQALLSARGETVATYTSPHILCFQERIRVAGQLSDSKQIVAAFCDIDAARRDVPLTYFEFTTLAALHVFAASDVDTAVLEVGLGGRLDAVNIVDHDGCLITNVSLDHTDWLGDTIAAIAREKAGVMRPNKAVIFGAPNPPAEIATCAEKSGALLRVAGPDFRWEPADDGGWSWYGREHDVCGLAPLALTGRHQLDNAAAALALLEAVGETDLLDASLINSCLQDLTVAGRQQSLAAHGRRWLLDGAHNAEGARSLARELSVHAGGRQILLVIGILDDKDAHSIVRSLGAEVGQVVTLTPDSHRAVPASELATMVANVCSLPVTVAETPNAAFEAAAALTADDDLIVVAGSFYTIGLALRWLDHRIG